MDNSRCRRGATVIHAVVAAGLLLAVLVPAAATAAETTPPPTQPVTIDRLKLTGSGCRSDTTTIAMSPDNTAFTVIYSEYAAQVGGDAGGRSDKKTCNLTLRLNVPAGVTYAVAQTDHRGYAHLENGASASAHSRYKFQGHGNRAQMEYKLAPAFSDNWQFVHAVPASATVYGPCGKDRKLDIDTELQISTTQSGGDVPVSLIAMDSTDGVFYSTYRLAWRRC